MGLANCVISILLEVLRSTKDTRPWPPLALIGSSQERSFADDRRIADFDPLGKFGSEFSMTELTPKAEIVLRTLLSAIGASYAKRYIKATLSSKVSSWLVLNWTSGRFS